MDVLVRSLGSLYRWGLDLLLPPRCVVCGRLETWLCVTCAQQLPLAQGSFCSRCGRPWADGTLCPTCQTTPLQVAPIRSAFLFEGPIRDAIHALKYRGGREVARTLGARMAQAWQTAPLESDLLVPVPLYPDREVRRGYNQAALLATALGQQLHLPVAPRALQRLRNTPSQTRLNRQARRENVSGAFAATPGVQLAGRHVTVVDDVATTGATLDACAIALLSQGARAVSAFTLARAP